MLKNLRQVEVASRFLCRSFAILVNFNLDPDELLVEASYVRSKLQKATEWSNLIGQRARIDFAAEQSSNERPNNPLQLFQLKHEVFAKIKLDKAFREFELLEGKILLPKFSHRVIEEEFLIRGRLTNAYTRQVLSLINSCCSDFEHILLRAWTLRERLHRDISMNRRFLENSNIEVVDIDWEQILHWRYKERTT